MSKYVVLVALLCLAAAGCTGPTAPRPIVHGVAINGSDSTVTMVKINGTVITTNLAPGQSCPFDVGEGYSVFYAAWQNPDSFKRSFAKSLWADGTVTYEQYQLYGCIWVIGRGFYTPDFGDASPTKY